MATAMGASSGLPLTHYALIYVDDMGNLKVSESASIYDQRLTIFTSVMRQNFLEILGPKVGYQKRLIRGMCSGIGLLQESVC